MPQQAKRVPATTASGRPVKKTADVVDLPRAARWRTETVLAELTAATGVRLTDEGRCRGGQIGACYVRWPDGHRAVLTCLPSEHADWAYRGSELAEIARAASVPAPRYELIAELPSVTAIVQELLPGFPPNGVNRRTVESMIEINGRLRGLLADWDGPPAAPLYLRTDGPGFCLHQPMSRYDGSTARLLSAIESAGTDLPPDLAGDDVTHFDFHLENVLVDATGTVTGVVDWDGAARAEGSLDLMTLRFDLARRAPELGRWVGGLLAKSAPYEVWLASWAHMSLRLVDWAIRELTAEDVSAWVRVATEVLEESDVVPPVGG